MDVKCERCGTEYEFDDAKVTEGGITVKCTHCGHLFKVVRESPPVEVEATPEPAPTPRSPPPGSTDATTIDIGAPPTPSSRQWRIRKADGKILEFRDLSTLQKWIIERKVSREDEISKTGESWKKLGSIVELSSFFLVVGGTPAPEDTTGEWAASRAPLAALGTPPEVGSGVVGTSSGVGGLDIGLVETPPPSVGAAEPPELHFTPTPAPTLTPAPGPAPPPPRGRDDLLDTGEFRLEGPRPGSPPPLQGRQTPAPRTPAHEDQVQMLRSPQQLPPQITGQPTPLGAELSGAGMRMQPLGPQSSARSFFVGALVASAIIALAWTAYDRYQRGAAQVAPRAVSPAPRAEDRALDPELLVKLDRADVAYALDTESGYTTAAKGYQEALSALGSPPSSRPLAVRALVGQARVALAQAEYKLIAKENAEQLLALAERALAEAGAYDRDEVEVALARADFHRLSGHTGATNQALNQLSARAAGRPELAFLKAANGLHDAGDPAEVAQRLDALPAAARDLPRARFLHAEALRRAGRQQDAEEALFALVAANPKHAPARRMLKAFNARDADAPPIAKPPAPPEAARPPPEAAGPPPVAARPPAAAAPPKPKARVVKPKARPKPPAPKPRAAAPAKAPSADEVAGMGYDALMQRGYRLLEAGNSAAAMGLFQRASKAKPGSPEPWANLGWCYMDQHRYSTAIVQFNKSLERSPRYGDAMYGLAEAHEKAGRKPDAMEAYKRYLEAYPRGRKANMARRKIERLQ